MEANKFNEINSYTKYLILVERRVLHYIPSRFMVSVSMYLCIQLEIIFHVEIQKLNSIPA